MYDGEDLWWCRTPPPTTQSWDNYCISNTTYDLVNTAIHNNTKAPRLIRDDSGNIICNTAGFCSGLCGCGELLMFTHQIISYMLKETSWKGGINILLPGAKPHTNTKAPWSVRGNCGQIIYNPAGFYLGWGGFCMFTHQIIHIKGNEFERWHSNQQWCSGVGRLL